MKKLTKILSYLLTTTILSSTMCLIPATELKSKQVTAETLSSTTTAVKPTSKIIYENVKVDDPDNVASVVSALNSTREETTTSVTLQLADSFTEELQQPTKSDLTMEEAQEILRTRRAKVKEHYDNANAKIAQSLNLDDMSDDYYISSYAPFISIELGESITSKDVQNINTLAKNNVISTIFVNQTTPYEKEQEEVLALDNSVSLEEQAAQFMQYTNSTRTIDHDATGIVVGLLDMSVVDVNHMNMKANSDWSSQEMINCQTFIESGNFSSNKQHATAVATVLTGQYGVAKNLTLLSAEAKGSSIYQEIEWMLQNDVNIINISWSRTKNETIGEYCGEYTGEALYLDYVAKNTAVTIVKAVGNDFPNDVHDDVGRTHGKEFGPPVGYNMLVVGSSNNDGVLSDFSCYVEATDCTQGQGNYAHTSINIPPLEVPHVLAFGEYGTIPGLGNNYNGTSFAAPYVAGGIALLMKKKSELMITPFMNSALVMATATFLENYNNGSAMTMGLHEQVGTGKFNLDRLLETVNNYNYTVYRDDLYYNTVCQKTFYAEKNQIVQIATCNMINVDDTNISFTPNSTDYEFGLASGYLPNEIEQAIKATDYGLYLCDSNGNTLYFCDTEYNTEYLRVVIPKTGNYTIKIRQMSDSGENGPITREDYVGLAYYLI